MKGLQFITAETEHYSYVEGAYLALQGGCRWIQLRMKEASREELLSVGRVVRGLCTRSVSYTHLYGVNFLMRNP